MMLMQVEADGSEGNANPRLDSLDHALHYCETRTAELERQGALLDRLQTLIAEEVRARSAR